MSRPSDYHAAPDDLWRVLVTFWLGAAVLMVPACSPRSRAAAALPLHYPPAKTGDAATDYHGISVADHYRWLEDLDSPETRRWIEAQNALARRHLDVNRDRERIRRLVDVLAAQPRPEMPIRIGEQYFLLRHGVGQPVLVVQQSLGDDSTVLLDVNQFTGNTPPTLVHEFLHVSPDGRFLAYGLDRDGADWQELRVRDVRNGQDLPDRILGMRTWMWASWTADGAGFFYTREHPAPAAAAGEKGPDQVLYHRLGTPQSSDRLIFDGSKQPSLAVRASVTADGRYLHFWVGEGNEPRNRLWVMDLVNHQRPDLSAPIVPLVDTGDAAYFVAGNHGSVFFVATTSEAPHGRVVAIDVREPGRDRWRTVVPATEGFLTVDFQTPERLRVVGGRLVVVRRNGPSDALEMYALDGRFMGELPLAGTGFVSRVHGTPDHPELLYSLSRFPHPVSIHRYDLLTDEQQRVVAPQVPFDPDRYQTERVFLTGKDGTRISMFLTHRKGIRRDGSHPVYLTGYGGFGGGVGPAGSGPLARVQNTAWLEMGGIVAAANLRGDGTYGEAWHRAGMRENKQNTFDDFIAAAEFLIREGYTSSRRLSIGGSSNGGLLVAAVMTQRPDLFAVALPDVPITDMLRYAALPGGYIGAAEYGVPDTRVAFRYLYAYSPLHKVRQGVCYPSTLITTGLNDENVHASHSLRFAASLQAAQSCDRPVLLLTEPDAGHGGAPGASRLQKVTDLLAFLARELGVETLGSIRKH